MLWLGAFATALILLFISPYLALLWRRHQPQDDWPEPNYFKTSAGPMAYYQFGNGPDLVLIHGLGASSYCWRYLIPYLSPHFRLTLVDLIGFGHSARPNKAYLLDQQADWLRETIVGLGLKPVALVGSSLGGTLSLWLAMVSPQICPQVIALAPATMGNGYAQWAKGFFALPDLITRLLVNRFTMPWLVYNVVGTFKVLNKKTLEHYLNPYLAPSSLNSFIRCLTSIGDPRMPKIFRQIEQSVLLLCGSNDRQVTDKHMAQLKSCLKNATFHKLNSHHHPQEQIPKELSERILVWLDTRQTHRLT